MSRPSNTPEFWKERLDWILEYGKDLRTAIFDCSEEKWNKAEAQHRGTLQHKIALDDSVLDVGCGYGRLLDLLPKGWFGSYLGIDISPDFIHLAQIRYPGRQFLIKDVLELPITEDKFDWAVCIMVKGMISLDFGEEAWNTINDRLRLLAHRILTLETGDNV